MRSEDPLRCRSVLRADIREFGWQRHGEGTAVLLDALTNRIVQFHDWMYRELPDTIQRLAGDRQSG
jgi:hypothetical protein